MHRLWLGLHFCWHILLAVCLVPGPSWANTSKGTSKPAQRSDLTVENVWQHEVQKSRQAMKIKMLRDMGLEPMSALADEISLKIKKIYDDEINKTKALPTKEASEARDAIRASSSKFNRAISGMYKTMKKYKENKIDAARARKHMKYYQSNLFSFAKSSFGYKVYALLQDEIQKHYNHKQSIIFVRGELGADFRSEYKKALQNPIKAEQLLKPFKDILPPAESKDESVTESFVSLFTLFKKEALPWLPKNISIGALALGAIVSSIILMLGIAVSSSIATVLAFSIAIPIAAATLLLTTIGSIDAIVTFAKPFEETDVFRRNLQILLKYKLFQEVKRDAHSKSTQ